MNHEPRSVRTVVRRGRCRVAALALAVLSLMGGCATGPARTPEARPGAAAAQPYDAVGAAVGLGYERPPFYRIPPNYSFRETPAARGEGIDLMPWLVSEPMMWKQRAAGTPVSSQTVLVAETWFSPPDVVQLDERRQPVLSLKMTPTAQGYVNVDNVSWLFAEAFARYGAENVGLEIVVAPQATLNAMLVGLRPEWYYLQPNLEDVILTHVETVDRARLREFIATTLKREVPAGQEAEEVTAFLVQVLTRKFLVEELRAASPRSSFKTVWVTSAYFGLDSSSKSLARRIGLSDAQIAQIESAMYRRMSGPLVNASGMRDRRTEVTVTLPIRAFFDPAYAPENKESARGWGLVPAGKGRPQDVLPAKIFLAFGAGLGPDSVPLANRFPARFTHDDFTLEQRDVNRPGDTATIVGLRLVPLTPPTAAAAGAGGDRSPR